MTFGITLYKGIKSNFAPQVMRAICVSDYSKSEDFRQYANYLHSHQCVLRFTIFRAFIFAIAGLISRSIVL